MMSEDDVVSRPEFEKALEEVFDPERLRELAKQTGMVKRERKIDPVVIFWSLVFGFGVELKRSLASLKRKYENKAGSRLGDSSWYERFSPELTLFLKECVLLGIEHYGKQKHRKLQDRLDKFEDVLIQDSTIIRVHESLAKKWPAVRTRKAAAGVKVSLLVSAVANGPKTVALRSENTAEIKTLKIGPWVKNRILLVDLGFYKHQMFARVEENGGFFVSRLKGVANPKIVAVNSVCRGNSIDLVDKKWKEVEPLLKRQVLDAEVEIDFKRRSYKGKHSKDTKSFRLVAHYDEATKKYHAYLTNIPKDVLDADEIASLYGARWEIELIFKELKSKYSLDVIEVKTPHTIAALIWTAILTMIVSRTIYNCYLDWGRANGKDISRFTQLRWSNHFTENGNDFLHAILNHMHIEYSLMNSFELSMSQIMDPHVNRERFREEWWT